MDFKIKIVKIFNKLIKLQIWDTAGPERFRSIAKSYCKKAHGIILIYYITDRKSFETLLNWNRDIDENCSKGVIKMLVGNKCDESENIVLNEEEGEKFATDYNYMFCESSCKNNINVIEAFYLICKKLLYARELEPEKKKYFPNLNSLNKYISQ